MAAPGRGWIGLLVLVPTLAGWPAVVQAQPPATAAEILRAQPPALVEKLREKHVVLLQTFEEDDVYGGEVQALVIFDQPLESTMFLLTQVERQIEYYPGLRGIEVIEELEAGNVAEVRMRIMFMTITYHIRRQWDFRTHRISWDLDPDFDNPLQEVSGSWQFFDLDQDRTLGRFATRVDVGPALPDFLQDLATRRRLPETMERARKWVDSGGTYRP